MELKVSLEGGMEHFISRKMLQTDTDKGCTQIKYDSCFSRCPPMIPEPPPPPASLKDFRRKWCTGHNTPWTCNNTNYGPEINGENPKLEESAVTSVPATKTATVVSLAVVLPLLAIVAVVTAVLLVIRRNRRAFNKKKADNTYNLGYLSKPQAPTWTDNDGTEVAVEDGSEIFYQVDRTAALSAGMNGGSAAARSMPDVVHSSSATLRKSPPTNMSVFDLGRSGSSTSQAPLLSSPEIAQHHRRRNGNRTTSVGQETESDLGSPTYTRYGATSHQPVTRKRSHEMPSGGGATALGSGYMTYSPTTKSHPSLYSGGEKPDGATGTIVRTPKTRQRSFGSHDSNKPRPLRKPSAASSVQRSDSMTLNRAAGRENYKTNWDNFDEVTATMRKDKNRPANRELVLGTDSFIDSFTTPEQEEATSVDQLGLPDRNPFLTGYYDYEPEQDTGNSDPSFDRTGNSYHDYRNAAGGRGVDRPPSYDEVNPPSRRTPAISMSQMPTLELRGGRDRISEYDSEASVEV